MTPDTLNSLDSIAVTSAERILGGGYTTRLC